MATKSKKSVSFSTDKTQTQSYAKNISQIQRTKQAEEYVEKKLNYIHNNLVSKLQTEEVALASKEKILQEGFNTIKGKNQQTGINIVSSLGGSNYTHIKTSDNTFDAILNGENSYNYNVETGKNVMRDNAYGQFTKKMGFTFEGNITDKIGNDFQVEAAQTGSGRFNTNIKISDYVLSSVNQKMSSLGMDLVSSVGGNYNKMIQLFNLNLKNYKNGWYRFNFSRNPKVDITTGRIKISKDVVVSPDKKYEMFQDALQNTRFTLKNKRNLHDALSFGKDSPKRRIEKIFDGISYAMGGNLQEESLTVAAIISASGEKNDLIDTHVNHLKAFYEVIGPYQSAGGWANMVLYNNVSSFSGNILVRSAAGYVLDCINNKTLSWSSV